MSSRVLNTSKEKKKKILQPLLDLIILTVNLFSPNTESEFSIFQFVPTLPHPVTMHLQEMSNSIISLSSESGKKPLI